jgi:hypothetical protein
MTALTGIIINIKVYLKRLFAHLIDFNYIENIGISLTSSIPKNTERIGIRYPPDTNEFAKNG